MANKLKYYREKAGFTQQELAKKAEVSRNTISALETQNNVNVTYEIMNKLANALGHKVSTIFFDK
ncbi:MAG: helix-turn-helix domain-containing protein [Clostridia bacterium]|nr:helix-turn-helix domain-containing protein [Clostridia bacterium]